MTASQVEVGQVFHVPTVFAIRVQSEAMKSGRNQPLKVMCELGDGSDAGDFVMKLRVGKEVLPNGRALCNELIGAMLAQHFQIPVPDPAVVVVEPEFAASVTPSGVRDRLIVSPGSNFGSRHIIASAVPGLIRERNQVLATNIFAFDMLLHHADRRIDNSNMLENETGIYVIDHELAFPYAIPRSYLGYDGNPLNISQVPPRTHIFQRQLRRTPVNFDAFEARLVALTDGVLAAMTEEVPREWRGEHIGGILNALRIVREDAASFKRNLQGALMT
jgi:hypothetical protein